MTTMSLDKNVNLPDLESADGSAGDFGDLRFHAALRASRRDLEWLSDSFDNDDVVGTFVSRDGYNQHAEQRRQVLAQLVRTMLLIESLASTVETAADSKLAVLARAADHRIRNSLQQVISSLHRQAAQALSEEVKGALHLASARVCAIGQVHAALASSMADPGMTRSIDIAEYLRALCAALRDSLVTPSGLHLLQIDAESYRLSPDAGQAIGVIVTELVANGVNHAFPGSRAGVIVVLGALRRDGCYQIGVRDNGKGLPTDFDLRLRDVGTGLRVVSLLADKLRARLTADGSAGARFTLTLPPGSERAAGADYPNARRSQPDRQTSS